MVQFSTLNLSAPLLRALTDEGYTTPTPIQAQAIPPALEGRDMLGCAQTGTGKTAAFALPILHRLHAADAAHAAQPKSHRAHRTPRALILSPTRELAIQIGDSFAAYGRHTGLRHAVIFGGVSQYHQERALRAGVDILVATPGRLIDLMEQRLVDLTKVSVFVLDEADRMLDMGFIQPIRRIAAAVPHNTAAHPHVRQTLMFSATMPKEIMKLADSLLSNPVKVAVNPVASVVPKIEQMVYMVPRQRKQALLAHLLEDRGVARALVFTRTKHGADKVMRQLIRDGIGADAIHGNKAQNARQRALANFRDGRARVLVATDVAARGIDVDGITHVFNFDVPHEPESYVHRIGRTGRAGATGEAILFCDGEERPLLRDIERLTGTRLKALELPNLPSPSQSAARAAASTHAEPSGESREHSAPNEHRAPRPRRDDHPPRSQHGGRGAPHHRDARPRQGAPKPSHSHATSGQGSGGHRAATSHHPRTAKHTTTTSSNSSPAPRGTHSAPKSSHGGAGKPGFLSRGRAPRSNRGRAF